MDGDTAYNKLLRAFEDAQRRPKGDGLPASIYSALEKIILGDHLTFRYILVTAILAKSVDSSVHARSLQAQAPLSGAYDARSLCHNVVVPFERNVLASRLGGSNEPFLNKPARFVAVDKLNPVRKGRDKELLNILYDVLEEINDSNKEIVYNSLVLCMQIALMRDAKFSNTIESCGIVSTQIITYHIVNEILSVCSGGESAVIITGALFRILYSPSAVVRISPVNQAGASSRGVGDIDLMQNGITFCAIEVKDKMFTEFDVYHAVRVARESGINRLLFMIGTSVPNETIPNMNSLVSNLSQEGFDMSFTFIDSFSGSIISIFDHTMRQKFLTEITNIVDEIRSTDMTKRHIQSVYAKYIDK